MWTIYHVELPFFERYKISNEPWPWNENRQEWNKLLWKSIKMVSMNNFITFPAGLLILTWIENFDVRFSFRTEDIADPITLFFSIAFCMLCEDFLFHLMHRLLHHKALYPYVHKVHHTYINTVTIAAEYTHPIEYFFGVMIPGGLGALILGKHMHITTFLLWACVRIGESVDGHSGYEFSWSPYRLIPFSSSASYHNFHHTHNVGNYSSFFSFWDTIYGTNKAYYNFMAKMKEAKERGELR